MSVTVYTSEDYKNERVEDSELGEDDAVGTVGGTAEPEGPMDTRSDEVMDEADEFSGQAANSAMMAPSESTIPSVSQDRAREEAPADMLEGGEEDSADETGLKAPEQKTVDHLLSDFVIDLLEQLEIPEQHIEQLKAEMIHVSSLEQPEELMVHLSNIAAKLIRGEPVEEEMLEPSKDEVRLQAAKMSLCFLALLS